MAEEKYICRKCGFEFIAIPGAEEPPDCPECESDETEKLEHSTWTGPQKDPGCSCEG